MPPIITVENLGKKYIIRHNAKRGGCTRFSELLTETARGIARRIVHPGGSTEDNSKEDFWALRDISFEVRKGDRVGIIGRNGSGKSTLLKILSRITIPTTGRARLAGRVASLLEVGTGFHPDLTGRENIYLNGAILGMKHAEIKSKFDEIVDFAGVEKFLDTPVKRYSSGMYVRLAFAVAAHLEPEIMLVDEVLAVGDAEFQKKCLGKMNSISREEGRTILFVSHNMAAVRSLCSRGFLLSHGEMTASGDIQSVVNTYLSSGKVLSNQNPVEFRESDWMVRGKRFPARIRRLTFYRGNELSDGNFAAGDILRVKIETETDDPSFKYGVLVYVRDAEDNLLASSSSTLMFHLDFHGSATILFELDTTPLVRGTYHFRFTLHNHHAQETYQETPPEFAFSINDNDMEKVGFDYTTFWKSRFYMKSSWKQLPEI